MLVERAVWIGSHGRLDKMVHVNKLFAHLLVVVKSADPEFRVRENYSHGGLAVLYDDEAPMVSFLKSQSGSANV